MIFTFIFKALANSDLPTLLFTKTSILPVFNKSQLRQGSPLSFGIHPNDDYIVGNRPTRLTPDERPFEIGKARGEGPRKPEFMNISSGERSHNENQLDFGLKRQAFEDEKPRINILRSPMFFDKEFNGNHYQNLGLENMLEGGHPIIIRKIIRERILPRRVAPVPEYKTNGLKDAVKGGLDSGSNKRGGVWRLMIFFIFMGAATTVGYWFGKKSEASNYVRVPSTN